MNTDMLQLLESLDADDAVYTREALQDRLPPLIDAGWLIWVAAFSHMHTRFNRHLLLNAPELWKDMDAAAWTNVMLSITDRSYAPADVFSTGRFDDIKFLCHFFTVDAIRWYFQIAPTSTQEHHEARLWVERHIRACTFMYMPFADLEDGFEDAHINISAADVKSYGQGLLLQQTGLQEAMTDETSIRQALSIFD